MNLLAVALAPVLQRYLLEARQMQTLSFVGHIPLVRFGIAFPAMMLIAEWLGHRTGDPVDTLVARRWSRIVLALFAEREMGIVDGAFAVESLVAPILTRGRGGDRRRAGPGRQRERSPVRLLAEPGLDPRRAAGGRLLGLPGRRRPGRRRRPARAARAGRGVPAPGTGGGGRGRGAGRSGARRRRPGRPRAVHRPDPRGRAGDADPVGVGRRGHRRARAHPRFELARGTAAPRHRGTAALAVGATIAGRAGPQAAATVPSGGPIPVLIGPRPGRRIALALLIVGVGTLNAADVGWAHLIGVLALTGFVIAGFIALLPRILGATE